MNQKILVAAAALFCTLFISALPASAWYIEMNNLDGDDTVEIWLMVDEDADETVNLRYYSLGFCFDTSEAAWINEYENNLPSNFDQKYTPGIVGNGIISGIQGNGTHYVIDEDYLLGTYTMKILDGAVQDGEPDIYFPTEYTSDLTCIYYSLYIQTWAEQNLYLRNLISGGYLVNGAGLDFGAAVPVPGSLLIMGSGLLGLSAIRRRLFL